MKVKTLSAFSEEEFNLATDLLSAKVSTMLGRKMEEADWDFVYCNAKKIPQTDWSNLNIDINHEGLGVEHKMLRVTGKESILTQCGTIKMHPAGTRSIRIPEEEDPNKAMHDILNQYNNYIENRINSVLSKTDKATADMRIGWLLWKDTLDEFIYFEEEMVKPDPKLYYAEWNVTPARGSRKGSKSLWIYNKVTGRKKYSVTTSAGAKIQPYFDVPAPNDKNLYYFKVQGVLVDGGLVKVWLTRSTAKNLKLLIGSLNTEELSNAIDKFDYKEAEVKEEFTSADKIAVPVFIKEKSYLKLKELFKPVSDEYLLQQFSIQLGKNNNVNNYKNY